MPTEKEKVLQAKENLRYRNQDLVVNLLNEYLRPLGKGDREVEIRNFLEEHDQRYDLAKDSVERSLESLPEGASRQEREDLEVDLWSQMIYEVTEGQQREEWLQQAKKGEPLEALP
jgi:hypothetical protein